MRAMILEAPRPVEEYPLTPAGLPVPEPGPGEIRLQVMACAVCHTDLHLAEGEVVPSKLPIIPGHQVAGVVDKLGEGVDGFHAGERAGVAWLNWATRRDAQDLLVLAAAIPIRTEVQVYPLAGANDALRSLKRAEIRGSAVLEVSTGWPD